MCDKVVSILIQGPQHLVMLEFYHNDLDPIIEADFNFGCLLKDRVQGRSLLISFWGYNGLYACFPLTILVFCHPFLFSRN